MVIKQNKGRLLFITEHCSSPGSVAELVSEESGRGLDLSEHVREGILSNRWSACEFWSRSCLSEQASEVCPGCLVAAEECCQEDGSRLGGVREVAEHSRVAASRVRAMPEQDGSRPAFVRVVAEQHYVEHLVCIGCVRVVRGLCEVYEVVCEVIGVLCGVAGM